MSIYFRAQVLDIYGGSHAAFSPKCRAARSFFNPSTSLRQGANSISPVPSFFNVPQDTMTQRSVTASDSIWKMLGSALSRLVAIAKIDGGLTERAMVNGGENFEIR